MKIEINQCTPTQEGQYLWCGGFLPSVELITVRYIPETFQYGGRTGGYLGVMEHRGRCVDRLMGKFSKKLEYTYDNETSFS